MEILLGMILLLQVLVSIQIMLVQKQVLQGIGEQAKKIGALLEKVPVYEKSSEGNSQDTENEMTTRELQLSSQEESAGNIKRKEAQETLINEVLSEIFS